MQLKQYLKTIRRRLCHQKLRSTSWANSLLLFAALFSTASCSDSTPTKRTDNGNKVNTGNSAKTPCLTLPSTSPSSPTSPAQAGISWDVEIKPIFVKNCASCHPGSQRTDYSTYDGVRKSIIVIMLNIESQKMPKKGPLSAEDQKSINKWIVAGMPEMASSISTKPDPNSNPDCTPAGDASTGSTTGNPTASGATYARDVKPMIDQYCISCHGSTGPSPQLDTLSKVKASFNAVGFSMKIGSMPRGGPAVPPATQTMFSNWGTAPNGTSGQWAP